MFHVLGRTRRFALWVVRYFRRKGIEHDAMLSRYSIHTLPVDNDPNNVIYFHEDLNVSFDVNRSRLGRFMFKDRPVYDKKQTTLLQIKY